MALLREHACHSHDHPDLTCHMGYNEEEQFVGDLRNFQVLRVLRLNAVAFCLNHEAWQTDREYVRLADTLPASIQDVTLVGWFQPDRVSRRIGGRKT